MIRIFKLTGYEMKPGELESILKKEDEEGFAECSSPVMERFLNGLIIDKRGVRENAPGEPPAQIKAEQPLSNNAVLKKIRIALELQEEDMLAILKSSDVEISKSELSALFRKPGHKHYKECGYQFLRNFLKGLTTRLRG